MELVQKRDDLYIEFVALNNNASKNEEALKLIMNRKFHPWEGGEGKVIAQYKLSHIELAKKAMEKKEYEKAIELLLEAKVYSDNLGEGKLAGAQENDIDYFIGCAYEGLGNKAAAEEYFEKASTGLEEPTSAMFYNDQPADTIFYQGLALMKLGRDTDAKSRFNKLYDYGEKHLFDSVKIDYFAVSLPDFLVFEEDLDKKNKIHCSYLMGLGSLGLINLEKAKKNFDIALEIDPNHQGIIIHYAMING